MIKKKKEEELKVKIKELTNNWKRALADYQNLEKRWLREKEGLAKFAAENIILKLLPILDTLEKTANHLKDKGLSLTLKQFSEILKEEGLEKIKVVGKKFDPNLMECVDVVLGKEEGKVVEEVRSGYRLKGKIIRTSQVKVVKKKVDKRAEELTKKELGRGNYM